MGERKEGTSCFDLIDYAVLLAVLTPSRSRPGLFPGIAIFGWWPLLHLLVLAPYLRCAVCARWDPERVLNSRTQPRLHAILSVQGQRGMIDILQRSGSMKALAGASWRHPGFMIITKAATQVLQPAELDCLIAARFAARPAKKSGAPFDAFGFE